MTRACLLALAGCATTSVPLVPPGTPPLGDPADVAMDALVAGDFAAVTRAFDPASAPPTPVRVAQVWHARSAGLGIARSWRPGDRTFQDGLEIRTAFVELSRGELECLLSIDEGSHRLASLFVTRPAPPARYADASRFHAIALELGEPPFVLPATLLVPAGDGPFPAAVLVHGSGPNDRDETVAANKPFRDIAEGLASAGIAVLRYDKRTFAYGDQLTNDITVEDEVIADAVAAVHVLAARPEVDRARVVVIGHSLGGMLAPDIARRAGGVAGLALLAPPGREPWEILRDQMRYLHAPKATRVELERAIVGIETGLRADIPIMGMPASYWIELASHDGVAAARALARPVLVLHGSRDYQVTDADFAIWKTGLAAMRGAELVTLPGDNHLLITGRGPPTPMEYKVPGHVDPRAIERLVTFVRHLPRA
ncbi:MAG: alpha/beta hydrolase family protein [Acidobacteriota bacterium]